MDVTELEENLFAASDAKVPFPYQNVLACFCFFFPCLRLNLPTKKKIGYNSN